MTFRPDRKEMFVQLFVALLIACIPAGMLSLPMLVLGAPQHMIVAIVAYVFAGILLLRVLYVLLHFPTIRYEIDEHNLNNSEGLVWRVKRSTPLDKITNVDVRQGPVERMLGIGRIGIFTPSTGATTPEAKLIGVNNPHAVRARIFALVDDAKTSAMQSPGMHRNGMELLSTGQLLEDMLATLKSIDKSLKSGPPR